MLVRKRKRTWCSELASFPDKKPIDEGKINSGAAVDAASVSNAWLRCGDGFQAASSLETKELSEKTSRVKTCFASLLSSIEGISQSERLSELTDIVWSSSGSDFSDDDDKTLTSRFPHLKGEKYRKHGLISRDGSNEGESQNIDWDNDSDREDNVDQHSESKTDGTSLDISDTDSCTDSNIMSDEEKEHEPSKTISLEISEYSSDSENLEKCQAETKAADLEFHKKPKFNFGAGIETDTGRSASDWLKSAQMLLQTPEKKREKSLKTPEDSAKKRKFLRGGLAERLNRLQNRKRAAISFWKHQCISDDHIGVKSGALAVKIEEMHEECTLCITVCHQLGQICAGSSSIEKIAVIEPRLKVLFAKETAVHLKLALQDVLYIHPPWQKLLLPNDSIPVIMNTYFSQKVIKEPTEMERQHLQEPLLIKRKISLAWVFNFSTIKDDWSQTPAVNQVPCFNMKTLKTVHTDSNNEPKLSPFAVTPLSDSLLDIVETQGRAGGRGIQVQVVVQRVYYLPAKDGLRCHLQKNNTSKNTAPLLNSDLPNVRVLGLFSLIDSLWPPLLPLKVHGQSQESEMQIAANLPAPSFCYVLAAQLDQRQIDIDDSEELISDLYFPPAVHNLEEILQVVGSHQCCSFWAHVVHRRLQVTGNTPSSQRQFWLFVTTFSLQSGAGTPKTLPVSIASSCVISVEVMEALKSTSPCAVFFKDALCGNGRIICIERTVLLLQRPLLYKAVGADITELTGPVKLDELDSATQVNSICTVRGTVAGVNERTAFSWPTCNRCGNGKVEQRPQDRGLLYCNQCCDAITSPVLKMRLEVFLHCQSRPLCIVKVKLLQNTISSLLESSPSENGSYEMKSVLGKEVGFLYCYVQSVTSHPTSYVGLEEIVLPDAGRN
ncbi:DNA repair-scaffolding protein isoform X3 [Lacerta agilis]|uniref:DNA repair-scaffolding protein isoform X3 n=1 Tax=Lacerta agilis TaxID=80427 RepID=UPI0014198E52|nr:DNA repair-scaffolding protein isoform X3 [Lacerta agilis]